MERVVELVKRRRPRRAPAHRLIALDLLQARAQRLGAVGGFLHRRDARAHPNDVNAQTEHGSDDDRKDVVDDGVGLRHSSREHSVTEPRLGQQIEEHVHRAGEGTARDERDAGSTSREPCLRFPCARACNLCALPCLSQSAPGRTPGAGSIRQNAGYTGRAGTPSLRCHENQHARLRRIRSGVVRKRAPRGPVARRSRERDRLRQ